ncbi:voltage-dependent calcium channel gamma-3 subunit isoform X2 [Panthera pardus]|uniref:Voltage-dependent calcium channel gamma-3 subunit n=44 Tax=Eutheria TaxID=9347 RepID=A0A287AXU2_PIG|nr:voltage-dependent calcium channel gamma-3 subunit [Sus scrofa]XP_003418869.1 voltage-dependent calcium channel gamma-3 subunit [Loxodonta africana]XP_003998810.1 voltage-dependent calcium channel gamma-3 subunit isoform X1 [Felis catus]XP_004268633.1 voltage-dependent calcium channel gamma-3 subunit isoform X1 [Orcinus orca]XP_004398855.1 PREDICTED: voltage-dependent calcium channel gamma-3 subunit [Odobenus rosmarus divergens]XP_004442746.1 PREDICTED: voltage-dependent calcium channel gamm|eukprot:XP_007105700.1 voltage-dependent calcium channel gamma-3 subunit [Physeter catodon]
MRMCDRGIQMLITTVGAFAAFSLMTIAVGTDYWLYSRGVCRTKSTSDNETSRKNEEVMTHSGLWRTCCLEGAFRGVCKKIDHFPEDADYEQDTAEYLLRAVRASSVFPILSVTLLFFGGLCVAASEFHRSRHNVILSAGIFFVSAGLSNIIGIIVYISANAGDPGQRDSKKSYSYGWSFYFGAFSFIIAEIVGVVAVHIYIEKHQQLRAKSHSELLKKSTFARLPPYRYRFRRRSSSRSTEPRSRDLSPISKGFHTIPSTDISMFTLSRDPSKITMGTLLNSDRDHAFLQFHNSTPKEFKESLHNNPANRRTTPV